HVHDPLALEPGALAVAAPGSRWEARADATAAHARRGHAGPGVPAGAGLRRDPAARRSAGAMGASAREPDDRGLPHGGHGPRRLPGRAARPAGRTNPARRGGYDRAVRVRARNPERDAVRVPRRRAARGAPNPGGGVASLAGRRDGRYSWGAGSG